jgi:hypothetical protein
VDFTIIVTIVSIIGTVANIFKKRWCFIIWIFTNGFWMCYDWYKGLYSQALLFAVYLGLAVYGLIRWNSDKKLNVGDKVWLLLDDFENQWELFESKILSFRSTSTGKIEVSCYFDCPVNHNSLEFYKEDLGKSLFLSQNQAKRELRRKANAKR